MMADLSEVEAEHGFVFGGAGESANADAVAAVVCSKPGCSHAGTHVQVHADTPLPVHCGGCFSVLLCDHQFEDAIVYEGTVSAPVKVTSSTCTVCGQVKDKARVEVAPLDVTALPASAFAQHLG